MTNSVTDIGGAIVRRDLKTVRRVAAASSEHNPYAASVIAELAYAHAREPKAFLADMETLAVDAEESGMRLRKSNELFEQCEASS